MTRGLLCFEIVHPVAAGVLTFILVPVVYIILSSVLMSIIFTDDPLSEALPSFGYLVFKLYLFVKSWRLWIAVAAGLIVYFWKRSQT